MPFNRIVQSSAALLIAGGIVAGFCFAQDAPVKNPPAPVNPGAQVPNAAVQNANPPAPAQQYRAKQVLGAQVAVQGDPSVGTVDDMVLDEHGNVDYLIVARSDGKLVTIPWDATIFNVDKRVATVQITPERFQQVPTYTTQQYPVYSAPAYRSQVYTYFGVTPGQTRRMVRRGVVVTP